MQRSNTSTPHYELFLRVLVDGPPQLRRPAVKALIAATSNKDEIIKGVKRIIAEQSAILYEPTPEAHEHKKYEAMIRASSIEQAAIQTSLGILGPDGLLDDGLLDAEQPFIELIDRSGMLNRLGEWENHVKFMKEKALEAVSQFKEKHNPKDIEHVAIFGLGGSGAPHDITAEIISNWRKSSVKIDVIHADSPNPDYIDENTLAIFSSFSGDTEEIINCYETVQRKTKMRIALTKAGKLGQLAQRDKIPLIQLPTDEKGEAYVMQPRESVCLQLTAMLTFLASIGLEPGSNGRLTLDELAFEETIIPKIGKWQLKYGSAVAYKDNPAKQLAFFLLYGIDYNGEGKLPEYNLWQKKVPCILVDRNNWAIGHEIRTQLHERSKINAIFYEAPEFLHNLLESIRATIESSQDGLDEDPYVYYFIRSLYEEPRIRLRLDITTKLVIEGKGLYKILNAEVSDECENPFQQALHAVYFNAHVATYLAILNGFDPLPVPTMSWLKNVMKKLDRDDKEEAEAQKPYTRLLISNITHERDYLHIVKP